LSRVGLRFRRKDPDEPTGTPLGEHIHYVHSGGSERVLLTIVWPLDPLASSFALHLAAENKAPKTIETHGEAVRQLTSHLDVAGNADVTRAHVESFIVTLLQTRSPATANNRFRALQQFFKWLTEEDYVGAGSPRRPPGSG
jgi:integrase-like protein